jgi:hypothetical protein
MHYQFCRRCVTFLTLYVAVDAAREDNKNESVSANHRNSLLLPLHSACHDGKYHDLGKNGRVEILHSASDGTVSAGHEGAVIKESLTRAVAVEALHSRQIVEIITNSSQNL